MPTPTPTTTAELDRMLDAKVPCEAPQCPHPAVWMGLLHHLRRQPILCQTSLVCDDHRKMVERHEGEADRMLPGARRYVCDLHGWPCEVRVRWRAL